MVNTALFLLCIGVNREKFMVRTFKLLLEKRMRNEDDFIH